MWSKNFRDAFCERYGYSSESYEKRVFWRCLHRRSLPIALVVYAVHRAYFALDFRLIRQLGSAQNLREFQGEIEGFRYDYRMEGRLLRKVFRLRLSGRRLMNLLGRVFPERMRPRTSS
jgi:hypothetical protein